MARSHRATPVPSSEKRFKQETKLQEAFEKNGQLTKKRELQRLKHRQRTHIRSARYCLRNGLYLELLRDTGWLIQVQTLIEQLEKVQS